MSGSLNAGQEKQIKAYAVITLTQHRGLLEVKSVAMDTHIVLQGVEGQKQSFHAVFLTLASQTHCCLEDDNAGQTTACRLSAAVSGYYTTLKTLFCFIILI